VLKPQEAAPRRTLWPRTGIEMRVAYGLLLLLALCGCSSLPQDGPSARSVTRSAAAGPRYALVDLDYGVTQAIAAHPPEALRGLTTGSSSQPTDLIADGDAISVSIYEVGGGGLFSRTSDNGQLNTAATQQTLPRAVVDSSGDLAVPFAGSVHVVGLRPGEAADAIRRALHGRAVNPQVSVTVLESHANTVSLVGEVRTAGHFPLTAHNDRLLDILASAGGPNRAPADLAVVVSRGGRSAEVPLSLVLNDPAQNIRLAPQDQIRIVTRLRKYSTFGALNHDAQTPIEDENLTLAGAMSRAGGLDTYTAAAGSVLVFRFERPEVARALNLTVAPTPRGVPVVYRLNFLKPEALFVANNFNIQSDDLLYVPRANTVQLKKFLDLVNSITQIVYNIRVTSAVIP
jgi:polysaccharide export outer membrane protein